MVLICGVLSPPEGGQGPSPAEKVCHSMVGKKRKGKRRIRPMPEMRDVFSSVLHGASCKLCHIRAPESRSSSDSN